MTNKGHYEPCWVPIKGPFTPPSRKKFDRYEKALKEIEKMPIDELSAFHMRAIAKEALEDES